MSPFTPMAIPYDRPVCWAEFLAGENDVSAVAVLCREMNIEGPDPDAVLDAMLSRHDNILTATAGAVGIHLLEVYKAATAGRIRWQCPFTSHSAPPVWASLDSAPWIQLPGVRNGSS